MVGESISHYTVLGRLGQGGMGEVYLAHDSLLARRVALKFPPEAAQADPSTHQRFLREARAAAAIDHPYVCKIYEVGEARGKTFISMEFVEGETLRERIRKAALPLKIALQITAEIGEALAKAHEKGIVHRDLKPANVMLTADGHAKVMDFGLAQRVLEVIPEFTRGASLSDADPDVTLDAGLQHGPMAGTLGYMSPEQLRGDPLDRRTDLFSLGVVFYEMLTGVHPFLKQTPAETGAAILREEPLPVTRYVRTCPELLEHIARKMLTKELKGRYGSASEILADLGHLRKEPAGRAPESRPLVASIAVLPFQNMSPDKENEYFSDGITEDITAQLSKIPDFKVIARISTMRYKGSEKDPKVIGQELGVETVLEGSVRRAGIRVRITASLVDVETLRQLWAETYDRDMNDVFAVQTEVSEQIATTLRASFSPAQRQQLQTRGPKHPEAYQLYLKGRYFLNKLTPQSIRKGIQYFREALQLDPSYARSYAGISTGYADAGTLNYLPCQEAFPEAKAAARKALERDESLAEAHASAARVMFLYDWDWSGAERSFRRAIELNPNFEEAHIYFSWYLAAMGRFEEALAEARQAIELDPLSAFASFNLGWALYVAGRFDDAIRQFRETLEMEPDFLPAKTCLGGSYVMKGMHEEGIEILKSGSWTKSFLAQAYAWAGRQEAAREVLAEITAPSHTAPQSPCDIAMVYLFLEERDQAFQWLEKAYRERDCRLPFLKTLPETARYRSDPRFIELMRRVGLEP